MSTALEAEAMTAEAVLPAGTEFGFLAQRPQLLPGPAPLPVVILIDIEARALGAE